MTKLLGVDGGDTLGPLASKIQDDLIFAGAIFASSQGPEIAARFRAQISSETIGSLN